VGYTLDEIPNDITKETPACFEPTIDYCVVKIPRFAFEKFPDANTTLTTSMKSVGEAMAIGRTFKEALQKGLRSLEIGAAGLDDLKKEVSPETLRERLRTPNAERVFYIKHAFQKGMTVEGIYELSRIDRWFLHNIRQIVGVEKEIRAHRERGWQNIPAELLERAKEYGFSDIQLARLLKTDEVSMFELRHEKGVLPAYKLVDTCAAEFEAFTPYFYSTYETENEILERRSG